MIADCDTNFVWLSDQLIQRGFETEYLKIISILEEYGIGYDLLKGTKDIWCRDYMPVQVTKNKFVQFKYEPWYLNDNEKNKTLKSNPIEVCQFNNIVPIFSDINLDGGNAVKCNDKVILTDRIFSENESYGQESLIKELEILFEAQIIIIPQINSDVTGHADGLVRFHDSSKILVNELSNELKYWQKGIKKSILDNNLDFIEIPWFKDNRKDFKKKYKESAIGLYINFLEVANVIIIPSFEIEGNRDAETYNIFKKSYPGKIIRQVEINEIAKFGGLLNCISWNIKI